MTLYKGLDDLLAAGRQPRRLSGAQVADFFAQVRDRLFGASSSSMTPATEVSFAVGERPVFPIEVFPKQVSRFALRVATAMGCPVDFVGVPILVVSGAAIGAARSLHVKGGWYEKPGLYGVIVGRPSTVKTPVLAAVMKPVFDLQDKLYQDHKDELKKYGESYQAYELAKRSWKEGEPEPVPPTEPLPLRHVFTSDTTVESLAASLAENRKGLLLFRDELTAWVRSLDQYKGRGTDRQFFLSAWSGAMVKVDRKSQQGKPIIIRHPCHGVLGGIQPDLLTELGAEGGKEDGWIHRLLFACPPEGKVASWTDNEISDEDQRDWQATVAGLLNLQPLKPEGSSECPRALQFNEAGKQAYIRWYDRLVAEMNHEDFPQELFGPFSKLRAHCARFALIIHLLRVVCDEAGTAQSEGDVDAEDVAGAVKLCDYFKAHFRVVYLRLHESREDQSVDTFLKWLKRKGLRRCTVRDICRANVCGIRKASDAERLLRAAVDRGFGDGHVGDEKRTPSRKNGEIVVFTLKD
jgi:hypothetical protein